MKEENEKQIKKGFFTRLVEKLDKKIQEKAKSKPGCNGQNSSGKNSCCS